MILCFNELVESRGSWAVGKEDGRNGDDIIQSRGYVLTKIAQECFRLLALSC